MARPTLVYLSVILATYATAVAADGSLRWDAIEKSYHALPGELSAAFTFTASNATDTEVVVTAVEASCRCTQAQFASAPCRIGPRKSAELHATVRFPGQSGKITQTVFVESTAGHAELTLNIETPNPAHH